jgi:hypothetical protein
MSLEGCSTVVRVEERSKTDLSRILHQNETVSIKKKSGDTLKCRILEIEDKNILCQGGVVSSPYLGVQRTIIPLEDITAIEKKKFSFFKTVGAGVGIILLSTMIVFQSSDILDGW